MLTLNLTNADSFLPQDYLTSRKPRLEQAAEMLATHSGPGGDFTGWVTLPRDYDKEEFARIQAAARKIQKQSQVLVVIGIGGSYLGARAVIELLRSPNYNLKQKDTPDVLFTGNGLSTDALLETISLIGDRDFSVNVISKSGTTTESAIAFRIFKGMLEEKYGKEGARERIYATTDKSRGALKSLADAEGYEEFVVPDAIGGRYSVLTAVGLLPIAVAGIDIQALMDGAAQAMTELAVPGPENIDGLNFLAGKPLSFVADKAMRGVMLAHVDGGVPNVLIQMPAISETSVGFLIYFFEYVCGLSGHLLEINPFNQPGVEAYKSNMFALLGKPGYEARQAELEARL